MAPCVRFNLPTPQRAPTALGVGTVPTWPQAIWKSPPKILTKRRAMPLVHSVLSAHRHAQSNAITHIHTCTWCKRDNTQLTMVLYFANCTYTHILTHTWLKIWKVIVGCSHVHIITPHVAVSKGHRGMKWNTPAVVRTQTFTFPLIQSWCVFSLKCRWV